MRPHVSLIVPVHNAEPFLERCLASATAQTEQQMEIICVDDASTDASRDIIDAYARKDGRFRVICREGNGGESVARNQGVALAQGEYLAFLDHDDMLEPDACRLLYEAATEADADIAKGRVMICGYEGNISLSPLKLQSEISQISKFYFLTQWWSALYRTRMIQGTIAFAEGYPLGADVLFLTEALIAAQKIICIDDVIYTYIQHPDSGFSRWLSPEKLSSVIKMNLQILSRLHTANIHIIDQPGYQVQAWNCFLRGINYITRSQDRECMGMCCDYIFSVMDIHKFPEILKLQIETTYPAVFPLLYEGNGKSFKAQLIADPHRFKRLLGVVANLRAGFLQKHRH